MVLSKGESADGQKTSSRSGERVGKPKVGGPFELVDQEGNEFGDGDMKGGFSIVRSTLTAIHGDEEEMCI